MFSLVVNANEKRSPVKRGLLLAFLFLFSLGKAADHFAPGDSVKGKYDLNDPRNPNCPCHKYQKLADEEYRQLLNKKKKLSLQERMSDPGKGNVQSNLSDEKQGEHKSLFGFLSGKKRFSRKKNKTISHHPAKHRVSDRLSRCFHF